MKVGLSPRFHLHTYLYDSFVTFPTCPAAQGPPETMPSPQHTLRILQSSPPSFYATRRRIAGVIESPVTGNKLRFSIDGKLFRGFLRLKALGEDTLARVCAMYPD